MDKQSKKIYTKAMELYQKGYIDKAIDLCEKGISLNLKNSPIINLKGMLLYLKGDLNGAKALWRINWDANNDEVAKKYISDIKEDIEREELYKASLKLIKELRINEAVQLLKKCEASDFNSINVGNALTFCYIKQGDFEKAKYYMEKVLSIDVNNKSALENKKLLINYGILKRNFNLKKVSIAAAAILIIVAVSFLIKNYAYPQVHKFYKNMVDNKNKKIAENIKDKEKTAEPEVKEENKIQNENKENPKPEEKFPYEDLKQYIEKKDFEAIYTLLANWESKSLSVNEKTLYSKAQTLIKEEGVDYFYKNGSKAISDKEYAGAKDNFTKAYKYSKDNYLNPHIVYMLGVTSEKLEDYEGAIKYYDSYIRDYPEGDYMPQVLYELAMIYKNIDANKAKEYAVRLNKDFPNSIYNNTNIKSMIKD